MLLPAADRILQLFVKVMDKLFTSMLLFVLFPVCRDDFNIQVLHSFVELHEFTDLNLVQALR